MHHEQQEDVRRIGSSAGTRSGTTDREADLETDALAAYIEVDFQLMDRFTLTPGVRYEYIDQEREIGLRNGTGGIGGGNTTKQMTWGLAALYKATDMINVYAGAHKAFQPPSFNEAIDPTTGSGNDLDAETSLNYEVGLRFNMADYVSAEVGVFQIDFDNQINSESGILKNVGETRHRGIEASVELAPWNNWIFDVSATVLDTEILTDANKGNELPMAPAQQYHWGAAYETRFMGGWLGHVRLEGMFVDEQFTDEANTVAETADGNNGQLPSYTVWNLKAETNQGNWKIFGGVNNLLDKAYRERRQSFFNGIIPGATRNFFLGASLSF